MNNFNTKNIEKGFSLVEVILAIGLFGIFVTGLLGLIYTSYGSDLQVEQKDVATLYAQEGLEASWSIRRQAWNLLANGDHGATTTNGYWEFAGTSDALDNFYTRVITIEDACRDSGGNLVNCSTLGSSVDVFSKLVTSVVAYTSITGIGNTVTLNSYLTNWQSEEWVQTDWIGGSGQSIWSNVAQYDLDDSNVDVSTTGEVKLVASGGLGCGTQVWEFNNSNNYTYDNTKISVTFSVDPDGVAELISSSSSCNGTPTACNTYGNQLSCEGQDVCSWTGGAGSCVNIGGGSCSAVPSNLCNSSCSVAGCSKKGPNCTGTLNCTAFGSQGACETCGQCLWNSGGGSCSGTATACNTYGDSVSCGAQSGCSWSAGSYPTDGPSVNPTASYSASGVEQWSSFTETAFKNGGEIYYQLSDDDGSTWYYWNGAAWASAGSTNYNTALVVDANISNFSTSTEKILFKAFLESDGTQQVQLDQIQISWGEGESGGSGYASSGYLISSAFDMTGNASVDIITWTEVIPSCSPTCSIKLQLRTAPDSGGSPGTWTSWYGESGAGTYFTDFTGTVVSSDFNFNQWVQYRAELTGDGNDTPILQDVIINYLP